MNYKISQKRLLLRSLTALVMMLMFASQPILCNAEIVWSDDFDDGTYDGWTVGEGSFSASEYMLEATGEFPNNIYHESSVITGTWSFDVLIETPPSGYCLVIFNGFDFGWWGDNYG
jgi:hypothetical protein